MSGTLAQTLVTTAGGVLVALITGWFAWSKKSATDRQEGQPVSPQTDAMTAFASFAAHLLPWSDRISKWADKTYEAHRVCDPTWPPPPPMPSLDDPD